MDLVSDMVRLGAFHRARETARQDAVFRDPYAAVLAGAPDAIITQTLAVADKVAWFYTARTYAIDRLLTREIAAGADLVVQLAAGLDARPYRLDLPASLRWVEIDAPEILDYKADVLSGAAAACRVERVDVDLANPDARRGLFTDLGRGATRAIVLAEGFLIHLMSSEVAALSRDLAAVASFAQWVIDVPSQGLIALLNETSGELVRRAGAPYVFSPIEGPAFFREDGWNVLRVRSLLKTAQTLERLPIALRLAAMLPDNSALGERPWAAACLLGKEAVESTSTQR